MKKAVVKKSDLTYFYNTNNTIKSNEDLKRILNESISKLSDTVKVEVLRFLSFLDSPTKEGIEITCSNIQAIIDVQSEQNIKYALIHAQSGFRGIRKGGEKGKRYLGK